VYLEYLLKMKIEKFKRLPDDTPIDLNVPIWLGIPYEAAILGQKYHHTPEEEPTFDKQPVIADDSPLEPVFDFDNSEMVQTAIRFYTAIKSLVGDRFNVVFPYWIRGPQGMGLYTRGYENFLTDIYLNPDFTRRLLRYVTEAAKAYAAWRARFLDEAVPLADLFNDDIPIIRPEHYRDFILPFEQEISDFHGGVYYWHSCGNTTKHIPEILKLRNLKLADLGPAIADKPAAIRVFAGVDRARPTEIRFAADRLVQTASEDRIRQYITETICACQAAGMEKYVLRVSGMSLLLGAEEDLRKLQTWIRVTRAVQDELVAQAR
jgi:uroporphyrinogen-III decarboxylase